MNKGYSNRIGQIGMSKKKEIFTMISILVLGTTFINNQK